jgi:hypothetical protein
VTKKIWIDLDNSPHVPFFAPIIEELERKGYSILLTARDAFQVRELAEAANLNARRIGRHFGKRKILKVVGLGIRTAQLLPLIRREKPDLAVSHGSRAQLVASAIARVPSVLIMDYEYARGLILGRPSWVMIPDTISANKIPIAADHVLKYPGIKEDVYVPRFRPNSAIKTQLGINDSDLMVTIRPPANEAHYHNPDSDRLFTAVLERLSQLQNLRIVLLPRNHSQELAIRKKWPQLFDRNMLVVPEHAVDGLNLIWHSDLVISGGGTMNREAAALGVPVYSIFRGQIGAVDRYLAAHGRLVLLESAGDVATKLMVQQRTVETIRKAGYSAALEAIVCHISCIAEGRAPGAAKREQYVQPQPLARN